MDREAIAPQADGDRGAPAAAEPDLGWAVAGMSAAAGVIHFTMVPVHGGGSSMLDPVGFAVAGWFQLVVAGIILTGRARRSTYLAAVVGNLGLLGLWVWSRTVGLPFGSHEGVVEDVGAIDAVCASLEVGVVLLAARLLLTGEERRPNRVAPALFAVAALGLATTVIVSPDAADHGGDGHSHGEGPDGDHAALMDQIDETRCDTGFNPPSYWSEADYLGIDTYFGGKMSASDHGGGDHEHGSGPSGASGPTTTTEPDPSGGRGSQVLDELIAHTDGAGKSESAAARLVTALSEVSDDDYDQWLWWLRSSGSVSHDHGSAAPGDSGGHGGHVGPQPWVAMTDPAQCDRLAEEIEIARETALKYPTAADAIEAGYFRVTPYVPGIAAHYMRFRYVDGVFDIEKPEMMLYDGNGPDAHIVGLSYYIIQPGEIAPTQGFTGDNDHSHRHVGLCQNGSGVIGDSSLSEEECKARGGTKGNGLDGWMSHAWVVPGCESPWGVFSAASPVLDRTLAEASGDGELGCGGSGVRDRYDLDAGVGTTAGDGESASADTTGN